ncbi:hypothetical protein KA005_18085 [bacterium]|nr:hypothetical protein [bacterium]
MSKIIIGIHGLGNKPPFHTLQKWWEMSIGDGLSSINHPFPLFNFKFVYWANFIYSEPLDLKEKNVEHPLFLEDPYSPEGKIERGKLEPLQKRIRDYLEKQLDKLLLNEDLSINFSSISDFIIRHFFHDLDIYYSSNLQDKDRSNYLAREAIRGNLADMLRSHRNDEILIIAHSMGSIIAYDVLTKIVPDITVDTFVTCGSPLGIPVIMNKIKAEQQDKEVPLSVPENITRHWYNLSDLRDRVAINYNLADDYQNNLKGVAIIDKQVHNTYEFSGEKNPHKSYGYLRTPEMSEIIYTFLCRGRSPLSVWLTEQFYRLFYRNRLKK